MSEIFGPLPEPLLDPFILKQHQLGLISKKTIRKLIQQKLEEIDTFPIKSGSGSNSNSKIKTITIDEIFV